MVQKLLISISSMWGVMGNSPRKIEKGNLVLVSLYPSCAPYSSSSPLGGLLYCYPTLPPLPPATKTRQPPPTTLGSLSCCLDTSVFNDGFWCYRRLFLLWPLMFWWPWEALWWGFSGTRLPARVRTWAHRGQTSRGTARRPGATAAPVGGLISYRVTYLSLIYTHLNFLN